MWTLHGTCMICGSTTDGYIADPTDSVDALYCYSCEEPIIDYEFDGIVEIEQDR